MIVVFHIYRRYQASDHFLMRFMFLRTFVPGFGQKNSLSKKSTWKGIEDRDGGLLGFQGPASFLMTWRRCG